MPKAKRKTKTINGEIEDKDTVNTQLESVVEFKSEAPKRKRFKIRKKRKKKAKNKDCIEEPEVKPLDPNVRFEELKKEVDDVTVIMTQNVIKLQEREGHIDTLLVKAVDLRASSECFQTVSKKAKRKMWWRRRKRTFCLIGIIIFVVLLLIIVILIIIYTMKNNSQDSGSQASGKITTTAKPPA